MKRRCLAVCVVALCCVVLSAQTKRDGELVIEYDRFKDSTLVSTAPMWLYWKHPEGLRFSAMSSYDGRTPTAPKNLLWVFIYMSPVDNERFKLNHGLIVLADGERFKLEKSTWKKSHNLGLIFEEVPTLISFEDCLRISKAKKVEMQFGDLEFELKPEHLKSLRDFTAHFPSNI